MAGVHSQFAPFTCATLAPRDLQAVAPVVITPDGLASTTKDRVSALARTWLGQATSQFLLDRVGFYGAINPFTLR